MVGPPGFEPGSSRTRSKRARQAGPRPESVIVPCELFLRCGRFQARLRFLHFGERRGWIEVYVLLLHQLLCALERGLGALHVDLLGALPKISQNPHTIAEHFDKSPMDGEITGLT